MEAAQMEMPKYKCHKEVGALKICMVEQSPADEQSNDGGTWRLIPDEGYYAPITVSHDFYTKHKPEAGGYYVVYEDGYASFSPAAAFESGYTLI